MMQTPSTDNILILKRFLEDQNFLVEETSNGFSIRLNAEHVIEVNALIRDSDYFWASFQTPKRSGDQQAAALGDIWNQLDHGLKGMANIAQFEKTQDEQDRTVFTADIALLQSVVYHGVVEIGNPPEQGDHGKASHDSVEPRTRNQPDTPAQPAELMTAEKALALLETVDGKMLRQSLDMMNLRRSSNLRLALTRIFRSAMDSETLMAAIVEEAGKLVSAEDLQELEMIRVISATGFLQPVVALLCQEVFQKK
jgi:hypothetical protein